MGETALTYQQVQGVENQQVVNKDSLSTATSLRTPIQQLEIKEPRHLQTQQVVKPKKVVYRTWSVEDSIYFNLKKSDQVINQVTQVSASDVNVVAEEIAPVEPRPENVVKEETKPEVVVPSPPVVARKSAPFDGSKEWLSGFILLAIIIAGFVKLSAGKYLSELFSSIRYQQSATKLFSSGNLQNQKPSVALTCLFFLSTSMMLFEFAHIAGKSPQQVSSFVFFLLVIAAVISYFFIKNVFYLFVASVFDVQQPTKEYLFNANMLSKVFGMACLPIVAVVPFVDVLTATFLLKAGLALFLIMYVVQLLRGAKIILHSPLSIFYMFLYFCALEILPLSILIKVMIY
ncbi:DUF4271 domain-containing protein [Carboxylicivirga sp. A043]|uniref:DUF4271 domain-containing protein n=1 Tax=Carboxylicivirga litoralis TaxID=2816963 RepID=UPI0021CB2EC4|nr:DUF4271 domain-containing protein [Carboxylicivirga sp. A043]MCU4155950.1 DUF4271 domain-containing protein [Carboxylicivirga sp. A043]